MNSTKRIYTRGFFTAKGAKFFRKVRAKVKYL